MYTGETFQNLVDYWGENTPEREAVYDLSRRLSYRELKEETAQLAAALFHIGLRKGDEVLTFLPNWHEFLEIFFASAKLGIRLIPCNELLEKSEACERLKGSRPKVVFLSDQTHLSWLKEEDVSYEVITVRMKEEGYLSFSELLAAGRDRTFDSVEIDPYEEVTAIIFTSGSTGSPKGVEIIHNGLFQAMKNIGFNLECSNSDVFLNPLPACHIFGIGAGILLPVIFGGKTILMDKFSPSKALNLIEQEKVTVHFGVPTMFIRELEEFRQTAKDISSLRTGMIGGAMCDENLIRQIHSQLHCKLMVAYGSTEMLMVSITCFQDDIDICAQTVGRALEVLDVKIVDDAGRTVEPGDVGELVCKGYSIMKGYYNMPEETAKAFQDDGWYHSGDLATRDSQGYIRIVGRKKDMIIRGGYNIFPAEVEKIYYNHPDVLEVCVLGKHHKELGEQTIAFIQLRENSHDNQETLREYAKGKIAKYKIPDSVILMSKLPRLDNEKIDKKALVEHYSLN